MMKTTFVCKLLLGLCISALFCSQKINAQIVIGTPNLGFSQACANADFNSYNVSFVFSPESALNASNQFSIELSDASGSFTDSTIIYTSSAGEITTSPATISFSFPTTIAGEGYKLKIKSTAPAASSSSSASFAAYYKIQDSPFTINNLIDNAAYCEGGSYLLTIDNPGAGTNDSPLNYPSLTFNWYKETGPTTSVFVAEGSSLSVNTPGTYFVETNYGTCTSNSYSNRVEIIEATSGIDTTISSSLGNPFCPSSEPTTLSTTDGISYQWYKDGILLPGATNQTYQTEDSGLFEVNIDLGGCMATGAIDLISEKFTSSINVFDENEIESDETLNVIITTSAINPEYQWFINDVIISDALGSSYEVDQTGNYKVIITETTGCTASKEFLFMVTQAANPFPDVSDIPNLISPNGDGTNDTWIIPNQYVSGTNTEVLIMDNYGKIVLKTDDYQNNWPESELSFNTVNLVYYYIITTQDNDTKKGSITIVK
ncbi:gliding motility-associated C-terminal domain-containing protein [Lacinutrix iliipiscaria]|uniref:Gliding motility-associated C-terminal domain-containing protein n=1 Tax=Lacinutrix iliipiscaria TaxID=1230532 RepID=A0ABW5WPK0_9FLAO